MKRDIPMIDRLWLPDTPLGATGKKNSHLWERHPQDYYVEPPWVSEKLFQVEQFDGPIYDPACGSGNILRSAKLAGIKAHGSDLIARFPGAKVKDWLHTTNARYNNIVSNPPFSLCKHTPEGLKPDWAYPPYPFVTYCLSRALFKVALILPIKWMVGETRSLWLENTPLKKVYFITPRPSMPPGPVIEAGEAPGNGREDFIVCVWDRSHRGPSTNHWLRRNS